MNKKKVLIGLLVILAVLAGLLVLNKTGKLKLSNLINKEKANRQKANILPAPKYTKTDLPADKLPEAFPKDIIQEKDAVILENFEVETEATKDKASSTQYTVKYITKKSMEENLELYQKYFIENKWYIDKPIKTQDYNIIQAMRGPDSITVVQNVNKVNNISMVDMALTRLMLKK